MSEPRAYTQEEAREIFLDYARSIARHWNESYENGRAETVQDAIDGAIFSLLVTLDGGAVALPGFCVTPICPSDDVEFHKSRGENWYSEECDIAGFLHENFYRKDEEK